MGNGFSTEGESGEQIGQNDGVRLKQTLDYLEEQVNRGKATGVDFSEVEDMLAGVRVMIETGELDDAAELINMCTQKASQRISEHERLVIGIRKAEREIKAAHDSGRDVTEAGKYLKMSRVHMEEGNYLLGIESARRALETLTRKKPMEIAWGSGLSESE